MKVPVEVGKTALLSGIVRQISYIFQKKRYKVKKRLAFSGKHDILK